MSIILPWEDFEHKIIYPEAIFKTNNFWMKLEYKFLPFKDFLSWEDNIKTWNIISYSKDWKEYDHLLNLNIILLNRIRNLFDEIKTLPNQNFFRIDWENSYQYMIIFEVFKQLDSLLELDYPVLKENIIKGWLILPQPYFFLGDLIKKTNNLNF